MRKVLSIVLALLMVSMMIPSMAFAADDLSATGVPAVALVAGQSFDLTITSASANVTVKVNTNVFDLPGTEETAGKIGYITCEPGIITITVKTDIPTEEFTSNIRIEDEDDAISVPVKVDDRLVGDVNGDNSITTYDAAQVLAYAVKAYDSIAKNTFNVAVANVNGDVDADGKANVTTYDAAQILAYAVKANDSVSTETAKYIAMFKSGKTIDEIVSVTADFEDPTSWETTTEPDPEPATKLDSVAKITAVYSETDGKVYYDFTAVTNATGYAISINGTEVVANTTELTGSIEVASFDKEAENKISIVALGDGEAFENSDPAETTISVATPSTALATWLAANGLEDVVITVYEITAE